MTIIMDRPPLTLMQVARLLDQPPHRLISLCEQRVVHPDVKDADGRGSSRLFSERNLLEFAVVLPLRRLRFSVSILTAIVCVLRGFEEHRKENWPEFVLPNVLWLPEAPALRIIIGNGQVLYVLLETASRMATTYGPIDLNSLPGDRRSIEDLVRELPYDEWVGYPPEHSWYWRIEINVTRVAGDLRS